MHGGKTWYAVAYKNILKNIIERQKNMLKIIKNGIWRGEFEYPWVWRRKNK